MMNVLHLFKTYYPDTVGGVEKTINELSIASQQYGVHSQVLAISQNTTQTPLKVDGHVVHQAKRSFNLASTDFSITAFKIFSDLIRQVDLVHYHYPWPFMDLLYFSTRIRKPSILTYHSDIVRQKLLSKLYNPLKHAFLSRIDKIVSTSPNYLQTSKDLETYHYKTHVIPIGLDPNKYPIPTEQKILFWKQQLPPRFFLFIGVLRYYKGLHILLEAAKISKYPIVIVGSGPIEKELKKRASELQLNTIFFLGHISEDDKVALLNLAYCVVFPSHLRAEAFGISLLEGAMYGKPLISCEIGTGTSYINIDYETGLVVKPSCAHAFSRAMRILWTQPLLAQQMGIQSQKRFFQLFTAEKMAKNYCDLYNQILHKNNNEPNNRQDCLFLRN